MQINLTWAIPLCGLLSGCAVLCPSPKQTERDRQLDHVVQSLANAGSSIALIVREARTGNILFQHNAEQRLQPASNMKLISATAALADLGPDYRYSTQLWTDGTINHHQLQGNLYLKGSGAPDLNQAQLAQLTNTLTSLGITQITGHILLDDTAFDTTPYGTGWEWDDLSAPYSPQISALNFSVQPHQDINAAEIQITANKKRGKPAEIHLLPSVDLIQPINHSITDTQTQIQVRRMPGEDRIQIEGTIATDQQDTEYVSVNQPTYWVGALFRSTLQQNGIRIAKQLIRRKVPENAHLLGQVQSAPLSDLIVTMLKKSNNGYAEVVTKTLGATRHPPGSWSQGISAIEQYIQQQGIDSRGIAQVDGSGLSRHNQLSVKVISQLLYKVQGTSWFSLFKQALPVAGETHPNITSTLTNRLKNTPAAGRVQAKTGTMSGISALSGYISTVQGTPLIFSMIVNNATMGTQYLHSQEDKIMLTLVTCYDNGQCP